MTNVYRRKIGSSVQIMVSEQGKRVSRDIEVDPCEKVVFGKGLEKIVGSFSLSEFKRRKPLVHFSSPEKSI